MEKIYIDSEKWINSFGMKKNRLPDCLLNNYLFYSIVNKFFALLL